MSAETSHLDPSTSMVPPEAEGFLRELAKRLEEAANAKAVFAAPIERDGATIVPIAKARWGMGGGSGTRPSGKEGSSERGTGGGGGAVVSPIGYIELRNGTSRFRPIRDPARTLPLVIAGGLTAISLLRTIDRLATHRAMGYRLGARRLRRRLRLRGVRRWLHL